MPTPFNERSVITNPVPLGQPQSNNTPNQAGTNLLGDVSSNSNALNPPAKLPLVVGAASTQIAGDTAFNSYGTTSTAPPATGANHPTFSTHDIITPAASHSTASTWSKFAQQSGPSQPIESTKTIDSFQQFKKQAKEKQDKEKLIEMQEQRRREREREQAERERLTQDQEGEMALNSLARAEQSPVLSPASDSQSPAAAAGTSGSGSSMLKLREQERRKREALANQNLDLSRQSEIMSKFESDRV